MSLVLVGIGGACGSLARYYLGKVMAARWKKGFPLGTFLINVTGAFLLGWISSLGLNTNGYLLLADGFLGAYTTFSTFMYEGFSLFQKREEINAVVYIAASIVLGSLFFMLGVQIGKFLATP